MLDWKNRTAETRTGAADTATTSPNQSTGRTATRLVAGLLGLYLVVALVVGWYWSQEPAQFSVQQRAEAASQARGHRLVNGYTTAETLKQVANTLLDKPGGYLSNDLAPPGLWLDNMPSWEFGVLVQVRDMSRALRKDF